MKVLICGDRNWTDRTAIFNRMRKLPVGAIIITGGAKGADSLAYDEAQFLGFTTMRFMANWRMYGKAAGPIRNRKMLDQNPDLVIAFHSDLEHSKGTKDCVAQARKRGTPVEIII
jgi:hypothetical protein